MDGNPLKGRLRAFLLFLGSVVFALVGYWMFSVESDGFYIAIGCMTFAMGVSGAILFLYSAASGRETLPVIYYIGKPGKQSLAPFREAWISYLVLSALVVSLIVPLAISVAGFSGDFWRLFFVLLGVAAAFTMVVSVGFEGFSEYLRMKGFGKKASREK